MLLSRTLALLITALVVALTIRYNTFASWATDSGAYVSAGLAWAKGEVFSPATFVFWAPWAADGQIEFPLGHVQGPIRGTITGQYPLGYPLLIAAAVKVGGPLAAHLVSPVLAGVLTWCAFVLGRAMATPWAGVLAALMIGATPVVLGHTVMPFSDVPATAFWAIAWVMGVRRGYGAAMAAGSAAAFAVMIRPNLAPLALVIALTVLVAERAGVRRAILRLVAFGVLGALGPLLVMWSQAELYGDPFQSGYRVPMDYFFKLERVPYNAGLYPRMLIELHSIFALGGLLFAPFALRRMRATDASYTRGLLAISAVGLILVNYALYLPYLTYVGWYWLRFVLPAILALFVLLAAGVDHLRLWAQTRHPRLAFLVVAPALFVVWSAQEHVRPTPGYERMQLMEHYLPDVLPRNAVVLTYAHGGALAASTGRPVLRLDIMNPDALDRIVGDLNRRALEPVFVLDVAVDGPFFTDRFKGQQLGRLTWPARAEMTSVTSILYYNISDRETFFQGDRWPTDVLVAPATAPGTVQWNDFRATHERIILPVPEDTAAFRTLLELVYRHQLNRAEAPTSIHPRDAMTWMRRYIRFRLHQCTHEVAGDKVWQEIAEGSALALCGPPDTVSFPPQNETVDFRRQLEEKWQSRAVPSPSTAVDPVGDAVWMQRYLELRVGGCSQAHATAAVLDQIAGQPPRVCISR